MRMDRGVLILLLLCAACGTSRRAQLEAIAKDWSLTIRASQVLPVYPLTEDLQPGDLFLVQRTVEDQHEAYAGRGFLPLENHLARLHPTGYEEFYAGSGFRAGAWPRAAFPSYSFTATRRGGFNLALSVSGVPVGLSLLGAREARATVTISDARTYGLDTLTLNRQISVWAARNAAFLARYASRPDHPSYLRVVCRVYLTGKVDITIQDTRQVGGAARAGALEAVAAPEVEKLDAINEALERSLPASGTGGSLKVVAASTRSITLSETFPKPLVIGYLGFDLQILKGGVLGAPIPTRAVMEGEERPQGAAFFSASEERYARTLESCKGQKAPFFTAVLERLDPELAARFAEKTKPADDFERFRMVAGDWRKEVPDSARRFRMRAVVDAIDLARRGGQ